MLSRGSERILRYEAARGVLFSRRHDEKDAICFKRAGPHFFIDSGKRGLWGSVNTVDHVMCVRKHRRKQPKCMKPTSEWGGPLLCYYHAPFLSFPFQHTKAPEKLPTIEKEGEKKEKKYTQGYVYAPIHNPQSQVRLPPSIENPTYNKADPALRLKLHPSARSRYSS